MKLFKNFNKYNDRIALISEITGDITYSQIDTYTKKIKDYIEKRSLVLIISQNTVGSIVSYISCIRNNFVVILVDIKTNNNKIKNLIKLYKPSYLIAPEAEIDNFNFQEINKKKIYDYSICKIDSNNKITSNKNLSLLLPTSGSMGSPKLVKLSNKNLYFNCKSIVKYLKIKQSCRTITTMPSSYSYMLSIINSYLEVGASIVVEKKSILERDFWHTYKKNKISSFSGVPYIFETLIKLGFKKILSKSLKVITQAGGKLDSKSQKLISMICKKKKIKFFIMYGQTEASPRISYLGPKFSQLMIGSIGKPIPGVKMWIENKFKKKILKPNQIGNLCIKGKNVFMGYSFNYNDLKKGDQNKGYLNTGDLAYFNKKKFFYLTGRKNRIIKIFGNRINLSELENMLSQKKFETVCIFKEDKIFILFEKKYKEDKLKKQVAEITSLNLSAFRFKLLKKFPRTLNKKIDFKKILQKI